MDKDASEILQRALSLPPEGRAALASSLLDSLDNEVDEDVERLWREEIRKRIADLDSGDVRTVPWTEVQARLSHGIGR